MASPFVGCSSSGDPPAAGGADGSVSSEGGAVPPADAGAALEPDSGVVQRVTSTILIADTSDAGAAHVDPDLVNAWGLAFSPVGVAWISDNGTGKATIFPPGTDGGAIASIVVPAPAQAIAADAGATSSPTGMVLNQDSTAFLGDVFIMSTEDGTVAGWQPPVPTPARIRIDHSAGAPSSNAVYKGLAILPTIPPRLAVANFRAGTIDLYDSTYAAIATASDASVSPWKDPSLPAGYAPFNIVTLGRNVFVSYALQDAAKLNDTPGPGQGAVSVFDFNGTLLKSLVPVSAGGPLDAPWGMALAPSGWGSLGGTLLVGNFGRGDVHAFNATTGAFAGTLVAGPANAPFIMPGLWSLVFGNDADAGVSPNALYFTAGPDMEQHGVYGVLTLASGT